MSERFLEFAVAIVRIGKKLNKTFDMKLLTSDI